LGGDTYKTETWHFEVQNFVKPKLGGSGTFKIETWQFEVLNFVKLN
jgi:hypothetical protein